MDTHQAIYDGVRSKISNGDIGAAVEQAISNSGLGEAVQSAGYEWRNAAIHAQEAAMELMRPCVVFKPVISLDGDKYCVLFGDNLQDGVAGFGDSPADAMADFDKEWKAPYKTAKNGGKNVSR